MSAPCTRHAHDLRDMIIRKGMKRHMAVTNDDARRRAQAWLQGTAKAEDFDPYIVAALEINKKARDEYGIRDRDLCPLCFVAHFLGREADVTWIDNVTDLMVLFCHTNDLKVG